MWFTPSERVDIAMKLFKLQHHELNDDGLITDAIAAISNGVTDTVEAYNRGYIRSLQRSDN